MAWKCKFCGNNTVDNIDSCWSCGMSRDGVEPQNSGEIHSAKEGAANGETSTGYGWFILFFLYGAVGLPNYFKYNHYPVTIVSMVITFSSFILLLVIYFRQRSYFLKKDFWKKHVDSSSLLSGIISYFLVASLVFGAINYMGENEKRKEIEAFMNNYKGQFEMVMKQEIVYIKIMEFEPKTASELKDKISKIDEYKNFRVKKNNTFLTLVSYFRETNSKYKKDKSVDEQINELEKILSDVHKTAMDSLDLYKKYLITSDEKYLRLHLQGVEKIHSVGDEVTKLITSIGKSL